MARDATNPPGQQGARPRAPGGDRPLARLRRQVYAYMLNA